MVSLTMKNFKKRESHFTKKRKINGGTFNVIPNGIKFDKDKFKNIEGLPNTLSNYKSNNSSVLKKYWTTSNRRSVIKKYRSIKLFIFQIAKPNRGIVVRAEGKIVGLLSKNIHLW